MEHRRIIKRGPIVLATREDGTMDPSSTSSQGLFLADTRHLSLFRVRLNGQDPVLMGSSEEILFQAAFIFTNGQLADIPARGLGILQHNTIDESNVKISITVANWALKPVEVEMGIEVDCDFFDSFEARGVKRLKRGEIRPIKTESDCVELSYVGLDQVERSTRIEVCPAMDRFDEKTMFFALKLDNGQRITIDLTFQLIEKVPLDAQFQPQQRETRSTKPEWFDNSTRIGTANSDVDAIIRRNLDDLQVLMTDFGDGWVPSAGLPRFAVPFGRDSLITGLETLMWNPMLSSDVLKFLARRQGKEENPWNYEQPWKIMHEMHTGELARLMEVPFGLFYGSVDSTVLFLVLGAEYVRWTGDLDLYHELEPNFDAAWKWVDDYGNIDGSGYVQYQAHTPPKLSSAALTVGLFNQGWKDSANAVTYADGSMVRDHPVALAEVQGDLYRALHVWSEVFNAMPAGEGAHERGQKFASRAATLKKQFNEQFWMPEKEYYAMALDGHHRPVDSITSNPLQCLWARLIDEEHVDALVSRAMSASMFTSWGIRTMADTEKAYNPFSYHNGSVWPFENALIAAGLKKYGLVSETQRVFEAMVASSLYFEYRRWPEVFAGVSREVGGVLARQPDASRPQAWSAGAVFLLIQTVLGIATRPFSRRVDITPVIPRGLNEVVVERLQVNGCRLGLRLLREGSSVLIEITDNPGELDIVVHPAARNHYQLGEEGPAVSR
ncbi:MAG: amylo-alpha-1,6-glucosidase [Chloroflexota bacterium]